MRKLLKLVRSLAIRSAPTPRGRSTARRARTATRTAPRRNGSCGPCSTGDRPGSRWTSVRTTARTRVWSPIRAAYVVAVDADDVTVDALYRSLRAERRRQRPAVGDEPRRSVTGAGLAQRGAQGIHRSRQPRPRARARARASPCARRPTFRSPRSCRGCDRSAVRSSWSSSSRTTRWRSQLLGNKREGLFPDYRIDVFEKLLEEHYAIARREPLPGRESHALPLRAAAEPAPVG